MTTEWKPQVGEIIRHDVDGDLWVIMAMGPPIGPVLRKLTAEEVEQALKEKEGE